MQLILRMDWEVNDAIDPKERDRTAWIRAGTHEVERIPNPVGFEEPWLVLVGTKKGKPESFWRGQASGQTCDDSHSLQYGRIKDLGDRTVVIVE